MKGLVITTENKMQVREFGEPAYETIGKAVGGWTEVEAPDSHAACAAFRAYHPDKTEGLVNCSSIYDEEKFKLTGMYRESNFGFRCHEIITLRREAATN